MSHDSSQDLSRIYRAGANEEPPAWLDAAIRAAAAEAGRGSQVGGGFGFLTRWRVPLAVAAIIMASASTLVLMRLESRDSENSFATAMVKSATEGDQRQQTLTEHRPLPPMPHSAPTEPAAVSEDRLPKSIPEADRSTQRYEPTLAAKQTATVEPAAGRMERRAYRAEQAPDKLAAAAAPPKAEMSSAPAPAPAAPSMPLPAEDFLAKGNAVRSTELAERTRGKDDALFRADSAGSSGIAVDDASRWLRDIEKLFADGREREARESLEQFRKRYPTHPIPDKLLR